MAGGHSPQTLTTAHGYLLAEVVSALQKCVRRGEEENALYWAAEMDRSGFGNYCWKRLKVICSEDVGPAWPAGPAVINALFESWAELKKKGDHKNQDRLYLIHAVV